MATAPAPVVYLNVGGVYFATLQPTLLRGSTFFSALVRASPEATELFVDRDPTHFRHVLNWMRGTNCLPDDDHILSELLWEADYYALTSMRTAIERTKTRYSIPRILNSIHGELRQSNHHHR